ncbi:HAD-IIB family hydrolase [Metabacillus iocasae]|uniref:Kanosamine-6-phosphate phosphatase n=1 Tax=Priestia iocasae TaxID=2291674 RepID=A0ABS2QRY9_9BACI|nr:kanosamine-6-phosphate phosphatase [Metabacillus iocasae]
MFLNKIGKCRQVNEVKNPKYLIFFDFDETYYPHESNEYRQEKIRELENYLFNKSWQQQLIFGWVTGSSIESVIRKMEKGKIELFPHFIASNLGTEITYFDENHLNITDSDWNELLEQTKFSADKVENIVKVLNDKYDIILEPQTNIGSSRFKKNYYYKEQTLIVDENNIEKIRKVAKENDIFVNINRCNPLAGDPEDSYDVDFIPVGTGKDKIVEFMLNKYKVSQNDAFAFGDSGNDLLMLKSVTHGFLVENATEEAKSKHSKVSIGEYAEGILNTLQSIIED